MGILDSMTPEPRIYQVLEADHRAVDALLTELQATEEGDRRRARLFAQIRDNLLAHAQAEQEVFYDYLMNSDRTRSITLEAHEEHRVLQRLIREIDGLTTTGELFMARCKVLQEIVKHHVREEEREIFRKAKSVIPDDEAKRMARDFARRKRALMGKVGAKSVRERREERHA